MNLITLRHLVESDFEFYFFVYSNPLLMKYIGQPLSFERAHNHFYQRLQKHNANTTAQLLMIQYDQHKVGIAGLKQSSHDGLKSMEVGVIIAPEFQRKGFAHQAKKQLIRMGFKNQEIQCVVAQCWKNNCAANTANQKLGFRLEPDTGSSNQKHAMNTWIIHRRK